MMKEVNRQSDHFFALNLLTLGEAIDSNLFPTLPEVEPVSAMVSTFPVNTFYFPITKLTQLSFLIFLSSLRRGFAEVTSGDSQLLELGLSQSTISFSSSSSMPSVKQGCLSASEAEMRSRGFFLSILTSKLRAFGSSLLYYSPSKLMLLALFCARTSLYVLPGNALTPRSSKWKINPRLNISQMDSYFVLMSLMLMTSGATQPGVPHRTKRYSGQSENSASPKSAMTQFQLPSDRKMRFQGFRSRCMIFLECISLRPCRMEPITYFTQFCLNLYLDFTLSQSSPPSSNYTTMQRELSDSKTQKRRMQFLWLRFLIIQIYFIRHYFPLSSLYAAYLEKALTAQFLPSSSFSARQTEAKLPFPIFFLGLNCQWKPR